jgi:serine/threonine-protein kinase
LPWALAAVAAAAAITMAWMGLRQPDGEVDRAIDLALTLLDGLSFAVNELRPVAVVSPAGDELVLVADDGTAKRLYQRSLSSAEMVPLEGTEGARSPFFSPDGAWVGFTTTDSKLKKVSLDSGQVVSLAEGDWGGGSWGEDGWIIYTPNYLDGLWRVRAVGGEAQELTRPDPASGELNHSWPDHVPGTDAVVFTSFRLPLSESRVEIFDSATKERRVLVANAVFGRYVASGHLLFVRDNTVHAVPFDRRTLVLTGEPVPVIEDALVSPYEGNSQFAVSQTGTLVHAPASLLQPPREIVWIDREGSHEVLLEADRRYSAPSLSPDGRSVAVTVEGADPDVWIYRLDRKILNRLTFSSRSEHSPTWYPDGRRIAFVLDAPPFHVYSVPADGGGDPVPVLESSIDSYPEVVLTGARGMIVRQLSQGRGYDLGLLELDGGGGLRPIRNSEFAERFAAVSPDERFVAYESDETGRLEIYIQSFPEPGVRIQVTRDGGEAPVWAGSSELFFWSGDRLFVTEVATTPELEIGEPEALFAVARHTSNTSREYDVSADGRRILIARTPEAARPREIRVVINWFAELERLAGRGGGR